jgi:hypothetical protein
MNPCSDSRISSQREHTPVPRHRYFASEDIFQASSEPLLRGVPSHLACSSAELKPRTLVRKTCDPSVLLGQSCIIFCLRFEGKYLKKSICRVDNAYIQTRMTANTLKNSDNGSENLANSRSTYAHNHMHGTTGCAKDLPSSLKIAVPRSLPSLAPWRSRAHSTGPVAPHSTPV